MINYSTKLGMYEENCGLEKVTMSWGHDEYMYRMLKHNKSTLPEEALYIIRQEKKVLYMFRLLIFPFQDIIRFIRGTVQETTIICATKRT